MDASLALSLIILVAAIIAVTVVVSGADDEEEPAPANTLLVVHADQLKNGRWRWVACWIKTGKVACRGPVKNKTPKGAISHASLVFAGLPIEIGEPVYYEQKAG